MVKRLLFPKFLLLVGFWLSSSVWALTLGNIEVISGVNEPFKARIALLGSPQELSKLSNLKVQFPDQTVFDQYGLKQPTDLGNYFLTIESSSNNIPKTIFVKTEKAISDQELFNELLIELSWTGGKLVRVYTILNPNKTAITVQSGDNLSTITQSLLPELPNTSFEQALIALFRLNPSAFIAGNIHRLKVGSQLQIPSSTMIESIPIKEARTFTSQAQENFEKKLFTESSEKQLDVSPISQNDRLLLSSSENITEQKLLSSKLEEELIAQKKIIEQAQARVLEIQKNILDLNKQSEPSLVTKLNSFFIERSHALWQWLLIIFLGLVFVYGNFFLGKTYKNNTSPEIPDFAKNVFATLDLNLDRKDASSTPSPFQLLSKNEDHGIAIHNARPHKNIPSVSDQKLRLNLAKSYIKISDYPTAKILLQELVSLGTNGSSDVVRDAKKYLMQIG